jgi:hypothetical protein
MSALESLSESEGCRVLTEAFKSRGYHIVNNVPFAEEGVAFDVDGWDAAARVGFEYRTHADKVDLTDQEVGRLGARMERGELYLFIIDDQQVPDAASLASYAEQFLDEIATRARPGTQKVKKAIR